MLANVANIHFAPEAVTQARTPPFMRLKPGTGRRLTSVALQKIVGFGKTY
jgi:hypothetical protein